MYRPATSLFVGVALSWSAAASAADIGTVRVSRPKPGITGTIYISRPPFPTLDPALLPVGAREPFTRWLAGRALPDDRTARSTALRAALEAAGPLGPEAAAALGEVVYERAFDDWQAEEQAHADCESALPRSERDGRPIGSCGPEPRLDYRPASEIWRNIPAGTPASAWATDARANLFVAANLASEARPLFEAIVGDTEAPKEIRADAAWRLANILGPLNPASIAAYDEAIRLGDPAVQQSARFHRVQSLFWTGRVEQAVRAAFEQMANPVEYTGDDLAWIAGLGLAILGPAAPAIAADVGGDPAPRAEALAHAAAVQRNYHAETWARADIAAARGIFPAVTVEPAPEGVATPAERVQWAVTRCLYLAPAAGYAELDLQLSRDGASVRNATGDLGGVVACLGGAVPPPESQNAERISAHVIISG